MKRDYAQYKPEDLPNLKRDLELDIENCEITIEESRANARRQEHYRKKRHIEFEREMSRIDESIQSYLKQATDNQKLLSEKQSELEEIKKLSGGNK